MPSQRGGLIGPYRSNDQIHSAWGPAFGYRQGPPALTPQPVQTAAMPKAGARPSGGALGKGLFRVNLAATMPTRFSNSGASRSSWRENLCQKRDHPQLPQNS